MQPESPRPVLRIAAAVIRDAEGRLLLVRKHGTTAFMQPGGKIEPGEEPLAALLRELHEELGIVATKADARRLGRVEAEAANEPGHLVEAELFEVSFSGGARPAAEIAELIWLEPAEPRPPPLAPLTRQHVIGRG
jgi:8-oxo-dGTP pyrophosphatase MutT (NUDIX family)